jgi:NADH dehydrogenase [ubiquinone] 1 alpha subcomplex assembly factor 6
MSTAAGGNPDPFTYCHDLVRKQDYEGYLSYPFYSKETRAGYLALKAFQVGSATTANFGLFLSPVADMYSWYWQIELASVHDNVSNPLIGKMRMQFWRDAIKSLSGV